MRRRLRLPSSSDEDEDHQTLFPPEPNPNPNPSANPNHPLEISDDDFVDAPDIISPPSPPSPPAAPLISDPAHPVDDFLRRLGLRLRREWLDSCMSGLSTSHPGFAALDVSGKAKFCFAQFLFSDMNLSGSGVLPADVHTMHGVELAGPFVLQVDEIVNISLPLRERYHDASAGFKRCLKLSMTDGAQRVFGMEYRPIRGLEVLAPAGLKVCIRSVYIKHGLLMLVPEVLEVLGGLVEELDAARQRLVQEVNKPPRGKRRRNGEVPSLVARARSAAWPTNIVDDYSQPNTTASRGSNLTHPFGQVALPTSCSNAVGRTREGFASSNSEANLTSATSVFDAVTMSASVANAGEIHFAGFVSPSNPPDVEAQLSSSHTVLGATTLDLPSSDARGTTGEGFDCTNQRPDADGNPSSATCNVESVATSGSGAGERPREGLPPSITRPNAETIPSLDSMLDVGTSVAPSNNPRGINGIALATSSGGRDVEASPSSNFDLDEDKNHMADEVEHPLILSGDREIPFTYLACLLAKWTASKDPKPVVQGKIKCFLTGVKQFQFKQRSTYELHVFVDDGSLISEVLIDHNVVQNGIGHSPKDVTVALSSSDKKAVTNMKEIMKRYQLFLANFEGTMLVEMSERSPLPVALEMNQGCPPSDAWMLLRRLRVFTASQTTQCIRSTPIDISP